MTQATNPRPLRIYRVDVIAYPTPNGMPLDYDQDVLQELIDNYFDPGADEDYVMPAWAPDHLEEWVFSDDESGYTTATGTVPPERAGKMILTDPPINVPVERRKNWFSRAAAERYAQGFRDWGCTVRVMRSKTTEWEQGA